MGDENSLQGRTQAHKHESASSTGGFLETGLTGVTNLSEGSLMYGSAGEIATELNAGALGTVLTMNATVPEWGAGGSEASMQLVASSVLAVDANSMEFALSPAVEQADISFIRIILNSDVNASGLANHTYLTINSLGSFYDWQGTFQTGGVQSYQNQANQTEWRMHHVNHGGERGAIVDLWCNTVTDHIQGLLRSASEDTFQTSSLYNDTAGQTEFNRVKVWMSDASALMLAGSRCDVYKVVL